MSREHKENLAKEAIERNEERAKRSAAEQIAYLDTRLGKGQGATKERARLAKAE